MPHEWRILCEPLWFRCHGNGGMYRKIPTIKYGLDYSGEWDIGRNI